MKNFITKMSKIKKDRFVKNRTLVYLSYIVGFISILVLIILRPFKKILFVRVKVRNFGMFFDSYSSYIVNDEVEKFKDSKIVHILYYDSDNICNSYLDSLYRKRFKIYKHNYIIFSIDRFISQFKLKKFSLEITSILALQKKFYVKEKHYNKLGLHYENKIKFSNEDLKKAEKFLQSYGISMTDKWVCIHNRDKSYKNRFEPFPVENKVHNYRNFQIQTMKKAAKYFESMGYYVFRVGFEQEHEIDFSSKKIIDYSFSNKRDPFIDIFLISSCELYFGSNSGVCSPAINFKRPLVHINYPPTNLNISSDYLTLPSITKKIECLKTGKLISFKEMYQSKIIGVYDDEHIKSLGYKHVDNSEDEILQIAKETLENISIYNNIKEDDLTREYNKITAYYNKKVLGENFLKVPLKLGKSFLNKNKYLIS